MRFVKFDELGRKLLGKIGLGDLPAEIKQGLVGQWIGHPNVLSALSNTPVAVQHNVTLIEPAADVAEFTISTPTIALPFQVRPLIEGFFVVVHQRWDCIYGPLGGYTVQVDITGGAGDGEYEEQVALIGSSYDTCNTKSVQMVYCDGDTDIISISLLQTSAYTLNVGAVTGANSRAQTTIWYAGMEGAHGLIP